MNYSWELEISNVIQMLIEIITNAWNAIPIEELIRIKLERLQAINPKQDPTRFIRDYGGL